MIMKVEGKADENCDQFNREGSRLSDRSEIWEILFHIVDPETMEFEVADNQGLAAMGGAGVQAAQLVVQKGVNALITGNLGPNAATALSASGIKVYLVPGGTVKEVTEAYKSGTLKEVSGSTVPPHFGMGGRGISGRRGL
jgi:predicted Fe-Mo cluster-binding NifX family protein